MFESKPRSTFFDEVDEPELGEKHRPGSRRSSFRKTLTLITESRRSLDLSNNPLSSPTFPRHRRSFSFHRRASSSSTSVAEYPQSPSQYYNNPEARMKLKMVVASPESFDQALEHGFPSTTKLDAMGGENEEVPRKPRERAYITESRKDPAPRETEASTFFDNSSVDSEDDEDEQQNVPVLSRRGNLSERQRQFEYQSYPTDHNLESDDDDDISVSDNDSPATPHWGDITSRESSPTKPEMYLYHDSNAPFNGYQFEPQHWDNVPWTDGPREMTLRMTLTKPELRAPEEQLYGLQEPSPKDTLARPKMKDLNSPTAQAPKKQKPSKSLSKTAESEAKASKSQSKKPSSKSKESKSKESKSKESKLETKTWKMETKSSKLQPKTASIPESKQPPSSSGTGKVRGLWRKVTERKS